MLSVMGISQKIEDLNARLNEEPNTNIELFNAMKQLREAEKKMVDLFNNNPDNTGAIKWAKLATLSAISQVEALSSHIDSNSEKRAALLKRINSVLRRIAKEADREEESAALYETMVDYDTAKKVSEHFTDWAINETDEQTLSLLEVRYL